MLFHQSLNCTTAVKAECINSHDYLRITILDIQMSKSELMFLLVIHLVIVLRQQIFYYPFKPLEL